MAARPEEPSPLNQIVTHNSSRTDSYTTGARSSISHEKAGNGNAFQKPDHRNMPNADAHTPDLHDGDAGVLMAMGKLYNWILNFSIVTRYFIYVLPLAALLAIPIIIGTTAYPKASLGGVRIIWLFVWVEVVWLSLWVSKIVAHMLPYIFQFVAGVVSAGVRKYARVIRALEVPLTLVGWALGSLLTFTPIMLQNPDTVAAVAPLEATLQNWQRVIRQTLAAALVSSLVVLLERTIIQLISINYNRKQFSEKIEETKRQVNLLSLLFDASRSRFPMACNKFSEEVSTITNSLGISGDKGFGANPIRLLHNVGRIGDKITSTFGNMAQEILGREVFKPNSAHSIVVQALEKKRCCEALAKLLWESFRSDSTLLIEEGNIVKALSHVSPKWGSEAREAFGILDRGGNKNVSLEDAILTVTEIGRERKSIVNSIHDVDQAISVLNRLLSAVVFIIAILIFVAFLNTNFTTTLATAGTAILSLSFVFATTAQEILGSCIFLFVKHPYDIGDRVDLNQGTDQLTVEHISLLFTIFKRVQTGKTVQIPNIVLNTLWIENVSRSKAMHEQITVYCEFRTSFENIRALKAEMTKFVRSQENARDFQPDVDIEVRGIASMDKLELMIECRHKSNWANETVRSTRRSKFMRGLVLALRKVPIYGPAGGDPALGTVDNPSYSVALEPAIALESVCRAAKNKQAKGLENQL